MTSASGQGAIIQMEERFYEVTCEISGCSWSILAQKLDLGATFGVMMTLPLPPEYTSKCDSCKTGFFGDFCEGKYNFATKLNSIFFSIHICLIILLQAVSFSISIFLFLV